MADLKNQILLVISPHPDDEVIGCGGLIKKIKDNGGKVYVQYLTVADTRDFTKEGLSTSAERDKELEEVAKYLKVDGFHLAFKGEDYHLKLDKLGQKAIMDVIERDSPISVEGIKPTIVAFPDFNSYNQDHRIAAEAAHAALRPAPDASKHFVETVLSYEEAADMWSSDLGSKINFFVPLSAGDVEAKVKAMELYKSQDRPFPSMRSTETLISLAKLRGSQCGQKFAEAYRSFRNIF